MNVLFPTMQFSNLSPIVYQVVAMYNAQVNRDKNKLSCCREGKAHGPCAHEKKSCAVLLITTVCKNRIMSPFPQIVGGFAFINKAYNNSLSCSSVSVFLCNILTTISATRGSDLLLMMVNFTVMMTAMTYTFFAITSTPVW